MYVALHPRNYFQLGPAPGLSGSRCRLRRGLGIQANSNGAFMTLYRYRPGTGSIVAPNLPVNTPRRYPPVWQVPFGPANPQVPPVAMVPPPAATTGTPVPAGYSQNSVFIANDGSQWEYSGAQGKWINVGTPYNLGPGAAISPAATPTPAAPAGAFPADGSAAPTSSTTITNAASPNVFQTFLDWLSAPPLIAPIPNWGLALGVGLAAWKFMQPSTGGRR